VSTWIYIGIGVYIIVVLFGISPFILSSRISRWEEKTGRRKIDE